ncbi:hypothetical protein [Micromonospora siamensis]|uniref:Uncharacterized protein n=1 Tax=Micromonospora siamensis TaxID=299152 RepID=A0A1C5HLB9_9ACTN|nr:hypothetical protein [Micromonospora siamensis]SCG46707.1 hypothetical protein GA0074704_1935 [Micromonospora siamensis]
MTDPVELSEEHAGGADPGAGAPDAQHAPPGEPDEQFQSPLGVAGMTPGGAAAPDGSAPADENPGAEPGAR